MIRRYTSASPIPLVTCYRIIKCFDPPHFSVTLLIFAESKDKQVGRYFKLMDDGHYTLNAHTTIKNEPWVLSSIVEM